MSMSLLLEYMMNRYPLPGSAVLLIMLSLTTGLIWWSISYHANSAAADTIATRVSARPPGAAAIRLDEAISARIEVDGAIHVLTLNVWGEFPRITVPASAMINASIYFPDAQPGEVIPILLEDGGKLHGQAAGGSVAVDHNRKASFAYQVSASDGRQRITLRQGGECRVFEFEVGSVIPALVGK